MGGYPPGGSKRGSGILSQNSVPNGRVIKYPPKCAPPLPGGVPGGPRGAPQDRRPGPPSGGSWNIPPAGAPAYPRLPPEVYPQPGVSPPPVSPTLRGLTRDEPATTLGWDTPPLRPHGTSLALRVCLGCARPVSPHRSGVSMSQALGLPHVGIQSSTLTRQAGEYMQLPPLTLRVPGTPLSGFMRPDFRFPEPVRPLAHLGKGPTPGARFGLRATRTPGSPPPSLRFGASRPLNPQDPRPPGKRWKKDHLFGGLRCKVVREWGGSAH